MAPPNVNQKASGKVWPVLRAILWSFLGVRKHEAYQDDAKQLKAAHLIIAGLLGGLMLVLLLLGLVHWWVVSYMRG